MTDFFPVAANGDKTTVQLEILIDGGALAVAGVWDWKRGCRSNGLYAIYHKASGSKIGPYYASPMLAHTDMKKAQKQVPASFWTQPLDWVRRQKGFQDWIDLELGKPEGLIGGEWEKA